MLKYAINPFTQELLTAEQWILEPTLQRRNERVNESRYVEGVCPLCGTEVLVRAASSQIEITHFYHRENKTCPLSQKVRAPRDIDYIYGNDNVEVLRTEIKSNMYKIYYKCYQLCNYSLTYREFINMCEHFRNVKAINYRGLELKYIPYVLLQLAGVIRNEFFFALNYNVGSGNDLWESDLQGNCILKISVEKKSNNEEFEAILINDDFLNEDRINNFNNREEEIYKAIGVL